MLRISALAPEYTTMHAYGHHWGCQLYYNPRFIEGLGLTDGEGTERIWSRLRGAIPLERNATVCSPVLVEGSADLSLTLARSEVYDYR